MRSFARLALLVPGLAALLCLAAAAGEPVPPAEAFLRALQAADSTPASRQEAWRQLQAAGKPAPRSVVEAIDKARERAWSALGRLVLSPEVRKAAAGLHAKIAPHQQAARDVVAGNAFSKEKLDQAMEPITKALDEAMAALRAAPKFKEIAASINEMEGYAGGTPLRLGWNDELGETLVTLEIVGPYAANAAGRQALERDRHFGALIDPAEYACIARLNVHRILLGLDPAEIDLRLCVAGKKHSEEMVAKNYFAHDSPTPHLKSPGNRAGREHTSWSGECIAAGATGGVAAFTMWYYSQGHHKIMISKSAAVGVGLCQNKWTLMMGNSRMLGAQAVKMIQYVRDRYRAGDDAAKLYDLAKWCVSARLMEQAEDELERVVQLDPKNDQAQKALDAIRKRAR